MYAFAFDWYQIEHKAKSGHKHKCFFDHDEFESIKTGFVKTNKSSPFIVFYVLFSSCISTDRTSL
jgi:hypothetical protein